MKYRVKIKNPIIGVPITFLDKLNPNQFEVLGITQRNDDPYKIKKYSTDEYKNANDLNARGVIITNGIPQSIYARILIRWKTEAMPTIDEDGVILYG